MCPSLPEESTHRVGYPVGLDHCPVSSTWHSSFPWGLALIVWVLRVAAISSEVTLPLHERSFMSVLGGSQDHGLQVSSLVILVGGFFTSLPSECTAACSGWAVECGSLGQSSDKAIHSSLARMGGLPFFSIPARKYLGQVHWFIHWWTQQIFRVSALCQALFWIVLERQQWIREASFCPQRPYILKEGRKQYKANTGRVISGGGKCWEEKKRECGVRRLL